MLHISKNHFLDLTVLTIQSENLLWKTFKLPGQIVDVSPSNNVFVPELWDSVSDDPIHHGGQSICVIWWPTVLVTQKGSVVFLPVV